MSFDPTPVVLEGHVVRLEPLDVSHAEELLRAIEIASDWQWMPRPAPADLASMTRWVELARTSATDGSSIPFAIIDRATNVACGSTRYLDIRRDDLGLEIGWTWVGRAWQRTAVNTECKRMLLGHAFDTLGAQRVQLKTDSRNERSQRAIERVGGVREGVLRRHMLRPDNSWRDSVLYSIVQEEWPEVRARLDEMLERRSAGTTHAEGS
ncbi:MAG: GNAT family protein [Planctomycetota bacterium]